MDTATRSGVLPTYPPSGGLSSANDREDLSRVLAVPVDLPGPNGKELCDPLVVCEPDIIIVSVKDIGVPDSGEVTVDWERWHRSSIDESAKQIYGAERWLASATQATDSDPSSLQPVHDRHGIRLMVRRRMGVAKGHEERAVAPARISRTVFNGTPA